MRKATLLPLVVACFLCAIAFAFTPPQRAIGAQPSAAELQRQFFAYSGARLVFHERELPRGRYHDIMIPLTEAGQARAAQICLAEVKKYPPGYLGAMRLEAIGIFAGCASKDGDGYRPYSKELGGYRYYGIWNGENGIAGAFYTEAQLPLTFHHEIFHHVDGTQRGVTDAARFFTSDDARFRDAVSGKRPYVAPQISQHDLAALKRRREGYVLRDAVSEYSAKTAGEDQAETARHFMTTLPDSLLQAAEHPELPGSQRILHCLAQYQQSLTGGPNVQWFVDVALGRAAEERLAEATPKGEPVTPELAAQRLVKQLEQFAARGETGWDGIKDREDEARTALVAAAALDRSQLSPELATRLVIGAAELTQQLLRYRLQVADADAARFAIWGKEDESGVNWTLRQDILTFGSDAQRLAALSRLSPAAEEELIRAQLANLRLVARYYSYIDSNWEVTGGTQQAFELARNAFADALPAAQRSLASEIRDLPLDELAKRIPIDGSPKLLDRSLGIERRQPRERLRDNPYLKNVNLAVPAGDVRDALHRVQPACVRFPNASGCCISPDGVILTAGHVARKLGQRTTVLFPDGRKFTGVCVAFSEHLDLAVVQIDQDVRNLPFAPLAPDAPDAGTWVCAIGQPGGSSPDGSATGYQPFHVSTGHIRGFKEENRLGYQMLGGVKHDAWTYWGHSGCPLFNSDGQIVAIHNSWDSETAMRHGVTYEAIVYFLNRAKVKFTVAR